MKVEATPGCTSGNSFYLRLLLTPVRGATSVRQNRRQIQARAMSRRTRRHNVKFTTTVLYCTVLSRVFVLSCLARFVPVICFAD